MTGKRILKQILGGWDYDDFRPNNWGNTQNSATKKWSKLGRNYLKKQLKNDLLEYNISTNIRHLRFVDDDIV